MLKKQPPEVFCKERCSVKIENVTETATGGVL